MHDVALHKKNWRCILSGIFTQILGLAIKMIILRFWKDLLFVKNILRFRLFLENVKMNMKIFIH